MKKSYEAEHQLKLAIRDIVVRNPLCSVHQLRRDLLDKGFKTANGNPLDWYYVAKVVRKLNREKALAVDQQKINERLGIMKENYRVVIEMLWRIIDYKFEYIEKYHLYPPKNDERIKAANTLIKLDLAILKAEMDAGIFDRKLGSVELNVYRAAPLDPEKAAAIAGAFRNWGIDLSLPQGKVVQVDDTSVERDYGDVYKTDFTGKRSELIEKDPRGNTVGPQGV
jgi:hypothetical protein